MAINKESFLKKLFFLFLFILNHTTQVIADSHLDDPYYQISHVAVEVVDSSEGFVHQKPFLITPDPGPETEIGDVITVMRDIIAFGKEIYKIIEAGKPVIHTEHVPLSILPFNSAIGRDITPMHLSHWKAPKFVKFKVTYKNAYGAEVVSFIYNINLSYGGKFQGKGAYLTNAQVVPEKISVAWGYNFNAKMSLVGLSNLGTEEDPIAAATLELGYSVSTILKEERNKMTIFISGDGAIQQL